MRSDCKTRIIVDTNLWISFLIGKKMAGLLDFLSDEKVELVVSQELLNEVLEVASRPKLKKYFSQEHLNLVEDFMTQETLFCRINNVPARCRDSKDDYLLELALVSKANYLITGDKDLLSMGEIGCCQIITVMEFDALISSSGYSSFVHENFEDYYHLVVGE